MQISAGEGPGIFFGGVRLLTLEELHAEALTDEEHVTGEPGGPTPLRITTQQGFQHLACLPDGSILMQAGFNSHVKAGSWCAFLNRIMCTTV